MMLGSVMVRTHKVKRLLPASGSHSVICPICGVSELRSGRHQDRVSRPVCGYAPSRGILEALWQMIALPDALAWGPRLRGVRTSGDAPPPRRDTLLSGPRFGGATHTISRSRTQAVGTSRDHRQGGSGNPDVPLTLKKASQRRMNKALEGGKPYRPKVGSPRRTISADCAYSYKHIYKRRRTGLWR
jgi:hypothetical protein